MMGRFRRRELSRKEARGNSCTEVQNRVRRREIGSPALGDDSVACCY